MRRREGPPRDGGGETTTETSKEKLHDLCSGVGAQLRFSELLRSRLSQEQLIALSVDIERMVYERLRDEGFTEEVE